MNRTVIFASVAIVVTFVLVAVRVGFFNRPKSASARGLLAQLPANMRIEDREYPDREARFRSLLALGQQVAKGEVDKVLWFPKKPADRIREARVDQKYGPLLDQARTLLKAGPIQFPNGRRL